MTLFYYKRYHSLKMALLSLPLPFLILSASYGATVALTKQGRRDPGSTARACFGGESFVPQTAQPPFYRRLLPVVSI